jgi:23S rRNA pseudoU1915 N3-methylase RlmH
LTEYSGGDKASVINRKPDCRASDIMQEKMKQLEQAQALAALTYEAACVAFDEATKAYRASVMAYDIATGDNKGELLIPVPEDSDE